MAILEDNAIQGSRASQTQTSFEKVRVMVVEAVGAADIDCPEVALGQVPALFSTHPTNPGLVVVRREVTAASDTKFVVSVHYAAWDFVEVQRLGSLQMFETQRDIDNAAIYCKYEPAGFAIDANPAAVIRNRIIRVQTVSAQLALKTNIVRFFSIDDAAAQRQKWLNCLNAAPWDREPAGTWLCAEWNQVPVPYAVNGGYFQHVTAVFQNNPLGWNPFVFFQDVDQTIPAVEAALIQGYRDDPLKTDLMVGLDPNKFFALTRAALPNGVSRPRLHNTADFNAIIRLG